jgi:flavin-dependent dehydrogenase
MKYDLIVVGGGPGGLMSAKTAAEDGLNVVLIERKRDITEVNRACTQMFYVDTIMPIRETEEGITRADGYIEPVSVEILPGKSRFIFHTPGFSVDYDGILVPYYNWITVSPSGYYMYTYKPNEKIMAFYFQKEVLLAGLLAGAQKAGVEVLTETIASGAENTSDGVKVLVRGKAREQVLEARKAIAADGVASTIVAVLGLNKNRQAMTPPIKILAYDIEGVETAFPRHSFLSIASHRLGILGSVGIGLRGGENGVWLYTMLAASASPGTVLDNFMKHPRYAPWFRHARVVKKTACAVTLHTPIWEPVAGNVVVVGDAGAPVETWVQGALACGYMAAKAIEKELNGQDGYPEYTGWWQKAFYFHNPRYQQRLTDFHPNRDCTSEELDYLYRLFQGRVGSLHGIVYNNLDLVKRDRPELYEKLARGMGIV